MSKKSRAEFDWVLKRIERRGDFLFGKSEALSELFSICEDEEQLHLVESLIERFEYLDINRYASFLAQMATYIHSLGYPENQISIVSMAIDSDSDSSQALLQDIKVPLAQEFNQKIPDCNRFSQEDLQKKYDLGYKHFIAVDEFTGTGCTIVERYSRFEKMNFKNATIDFCIMTGMTDAINHVREKGINIKVFNILGKGISDYYPSAEVQQNIDLMLKLEGKLAPKIKKSKLSYHSLGFRQSESLYYKFNGNIPNNVFPLFWWKEYAGNKPRKTLFTRVQKGY